MKRSCVITASVLLAASVFAADYKPHRTVYQAGPAEAQRPYVIAGIPIVAVFADSSYALLSLEAGRIGPTDYVKLWLLYQNRGGEPYLFDPQAHVKATVQADGEVLAGLAPAPPSQLAERVDAEEQTSAIHARYSEPLRSVAGGEPEPAAAVVAPYDAANPPDPAAAEAEAARARVRDPSYMYQTFINSAHNGLLKRNTVFPGLAVNGHVYIPVPDLDLRKCTKITVYLTFNDGIRAVEFTPLAGE